MNLLKKKPGQDKLHKQDVCESTQILQHQLLKDSQKWVRIFEFMMKHPEVFAAITNPSNSQKYVQAGAASLVSTAPHSKVLSAIASSLNPQKYDEASVVFPISNASQVQNGYIKTGMLKKVSYDTSLTGYLSLTNI